MPLVLLDTNILLVLIVGQAEPAYLASHKRTQGYDRKDFDVLRQLVSGYDGVVTTPHVLAEASNLLRQIRSPARDRIQERLREFITVCDELPVASLDGCRHPDFLMLGLTDSVILAGCEALAGDRGIELLTADKPIYNRARALGLPAELYG